jgi:LysR family transcriptional regulator, low CO2-responsive transcriptional regulator
MLTLATDAQRALRELQGWQRGTLRVGARSTPGISLRPPVLAAFVRRYPGITLAVEMANSQRGIDGVLARQWELGMIGIPLAHPPLHVAPYWRETLVRSVAPHHRLATRAAVPLADLVGETWMAREAGSASGQVVTRVLHTAPLEQAHTLVLQGSEGGKRAVMAVWGMAMVSRFAVTLEVQQGGLRVVPLTDVKAERDLCLMWRHARRLPAAVHAFLAVLHAEALRAAACGT